MKTATFDTLAMAAILRGDRGAVQRLQQHARAMGPGGVGAVCPCCPSTDVELGVPGAFGEQWDVA